MDKMVNVQVQKLKTYRKLVLGFSGGADSTALALYLLSKELSFEAVHFHHHLRPQSADNDALFCKEFCSTYGIPFTQVDIPVNELKQKGESTESAARRLRMKYWEEHFANEETAILLAHHKDDVLENFFIRSLRGSSASGLSGLREEKIIAKVTYLRPLLAVTKSEVLDFLRSKKASWCEDESNSQNIYTRNVIRNKVIPALADIAPLDGIYRTVANVNSDALYIEEQAGLWLSQNGFTADSFLTLHQALKPRVLRLFIQQQTKRDFIPGHDAIKRLSDELNKEHFENCIIPLGNDLELTLSTNGEIFIAPQPFCEEWNWQENESLLLPYGKLYLSKEKTPCSETFKKSELAKVLLIRSWKNGDRIIPFGRKKEAKVKDMFANSKTPHSIRRQLPLIFSQNTLVWIPEVKRAEFARFEQTDQTVTLAYERF